MATAMVATASVAATMVATATGAISISRAEMALGASFYLEKILPRAPFLRPLLPVPPRAEPRDSQRMTEITGAPPPRRARNLLSSYYGASVASSGPEVDDLNIDGAGFNVDKYVSGLLAHKSLPELMQRGIAMVSEIKSLDSDMQMLVYENYNKFISTTDTIQDMKTKVDGMEGEMGRLAAAVSEITESSSRINENLADRRVRIQKLNGVRRLLKKLSFIFELPTRLKRTVELDAGAEAVRRPRLSQLRARTHNDLPALSTSCSSSTLS